MTKRLLLMSAGLVVALTFGACGGSDDKGPTVVPTPTPPTRAAISILLDPPSVTANDEGDNQYAYKVNLATSESAGIGYTFTTVQHTIATASGVVLDTTTYAVNRHYAGYGGDVFQFTVRYSTKTIGGGRLALTSKFTANFIDDKQNALTATSQVSVLHHGEPHQLP